MRLGFGMKDYRILKNWGQGTKIKFTKTNTLDITLINTVVYTNFLSLGFCPKYILLSFGKN